MVHQRIEVGRASDTAIQLDNQHLLLEDDMARHGLSFSLLCAVGQLCFGMGSWKLLGLILEPLAADIVQLPDGLIH
jgi:hypothetical protein